MELLALLDAIGLAALLGVEPETVHRWRYAGEGPPFVRISNRVRYRPEDVERWLASLPGRGNHQCRRETEKESAVA